MLYLDSLHRPVISKSCSPCTNPLVTVPRAPITIGKIVTFMFHSFFQFPYKFEVLFAFFQFYSGIHRNSRVDNSKTFLFCGFIIIISFSGSFSHQRKLIVSHCRLNEQFNQYTRILSVFWSILEYYILDGLYFSYFQFFQSLYQYFGDCPRGTNHNWYYCQPHVPQFVRSLSRWR